MSSAKHTPGPWRLDDPIHGDVLGDGYHAIDAGAGIGPGRGFGLCGFMSPADARLIAAAPELLEALYGVEIRLSALESIGIELDNDQEVILREARAAIAKATGSAAA